MNSQGLVPAAGILVLLSSFAWSNEFGQLTQVNARIQGKVVDLTYNHGVDRRFWSSALGRKRDMYIYLPPGYDGVKRFPLILLLHGLSQDEKILFEAIDMLDRDVVAGSMPPAVIAVPDGSITGQAVTGDFGSFFLNSRAGRFADLILHDVYPLIMTHFAVRPEREAHAIAGASIGGFAAYNLGFKSRDEFSCLAGILPLLNLRYADCQGDRKTDFHPECIGWNDRYRPFSVAFRIRDVIPVYEGQVLGPLYWTERQMQMHLPRENPIEMLSLYDVQPGEFHMWVAYTKNDVFNADAQAEGFIYFANCRGISVDTIVEERAPHDRHTAFKMIRAMGPWLRPHFEPYLPD
jgi:hypothetical protein